MPERRGEFHYGGVRGHADGDDYAHADQNGDHHPHHYADSDGHLVFADSHANTNTNRHLVFAHTNTTANANGDLGLTDADEYYSDTTVML